MALLTLAAFLKLVGTIAVIVLSIAAAWVQLASPSEPPIPEDGTADRTVDDGISAYAGADSEDYADDDAVVDEELVGTTVQKTMRFRDGAPAGDGAQAAGGAPAAPAAPKMVVLQRWMEHRRQDWKPKSALMMNGKPVYTVLDWEIVEVMSHSSRVPENSAVKVRLSLKGKEGYLVARNLRAISDAWKWTRMSGVRGWDRRQLLSPHEQRFKDLQALITKSSCRAHSCRCHNFKIQAKNIWFLTGHYLGNRECAAGKTLLFHGCKDAVRDSIAKKGFDDKLASAGAFGKGIYFSPQACKACSYAENYLIVAEVALGSRAERHTVQAGDKSLTYQKMCKMNKWSTIYHAHAGNLFNHEERVVYSAKQCKPVYLVELTHKSPGGGK